MKSQAGVLPFICGESFGGVGSHARPHLPRELGSSRRMRQYTELRGGARLFPPVYAGRTRDNRDPHRR